MWKVAHVLERLQRLGCAGQDADRGRSVERPGAAVRRVAADVFAYIRDQARSISGRQRRAEGRRPVQILVVLRTTLRSRTRDHRFALESVEARVIRQENEVDVNGYLAVMRCA